MKRILLLLTLTFALSFVFAGCSSVEVCQNFNALPLDGKDYNPGLAHINVNLNGFYLFHFIPIFTSSVNASGKSAVFTDTVKADYGVLMLTREARERGAKRVYDIQSTKNSAFIPLLFTWKNVEVTGNATLE